VKQGWNKALTVGVLVAVTGMAFLVAYTFIRKGGYSERDTYTVFANFHDATGLTWKSRVQIAGIQIGEVDKIRLEGNTARLELRIKKEVELHADACVTKTFPSALLPDALLEATSGSASSPVLRDLPEGQRQITCVREATSVQALLDSLSKIAADVQTVTGDLAKTVGSDQGSLRTIIENVSRLTKQLDGLVSQNGQNLTDILSNTRSFTSDLKQISAREKENVHQIAVNVAEITRQLRTVLVSVQGILDGSPAQGGRPLGGADAPNLGVHAVPELAQAGTGAAEAAGPPGAAPALGTPAAANVAGVRQAVDRLNSTLTKLDDLVGKVNEGKSPAGRLLTDERMGRQLGDTVEGISNYVDNLVKLQVEMQLRSEWLLNQRGAKTYFGARIIPRPDKYYLIEIVSDPRGVDTVTTNTTTTRDNNGNSITTVSTNTLHQDKLTLSLQLAKRYGPATFRVGVIESSGGVGADLHFFEDRLQLSTSIYQFDRPYTGVYPRAKIWVNWNFLQHFYATAGADDFLNKWRSGQYPGGQRFSIGNDVFFGGGLAFTDDDIKTLIGVGGASSVSAVPH